MGPRSLNVFAILALIILLLSIKPNKAGRVLDEEAEEWKNKNLLLQSLIGVPVPPPGPNPGTHIPPKTPPSSSKASTINQKGFAGHAMTSPPPPPPPPPAEYPKFMARAVVA